MVLPLLLMGAGYGAQWLGSNDRTAAQAAAQTKLGGMQRAMGGAQSLDDANLQAYLQQMKGAYNGDLNNLITAFQPSARMGEFNAGQDQAANGMSQTLAALNSAHSPYVQDKGGMPSLFARAQQAEQGRVAGMDQPAIQAAAMAQGLNAMNTRDQANVSQFAQNAGEKDKQIQDAMRLYQLSNAYRNQALEQAQMKYGADSAQAAQAGNGYMLAGGLLMGAGQVYGAHQAAQPGVGSGSPLLAQGGGAQSGGYATYGNG